MEDGIDALLNLQTRPHKDFDALVQFDDLAAMTKTLAERGFGLKEIWPENRWIFHSSRIELIGRENSEAREVATAFVLWDGNDRELDLHVLNFDNRGCGIPAWNSDFDFPTDAFDGRGSIAGAPVRCLSARIQMLTHTGYELQDKDIRDLRLLHERFGIEYPKEHAHLFPVAGACRGCTPGLVPSPSRLDANLLPVDARMIAKEVWEEAHYLGLIPCRRGF